MAPLSLHVAQDWAQAATEPDTSAEGTAYLHKSCRCFVGRSRGDSCWCRCCLRSWQKCRLGRETRRWSLRERGCCRSRRSSDSMARCKLRIQSHKLVSCVSTAPFVPRRTRADPAVAVLVEAVRAGGDAARSLEIQKASAWAARAIRGCDVGAGLACRIACCIACNQSPRAIKQLQTNGIERDVQRPGAVGAHSCGKAVSCEPALRVWCGLTKERLLSGRRSDNHRGA